MLAQKDITYMEYFSKDICVYTKDREYILYMYSMERMMNELNSHFVQINHASTVNIEYIRSIHGFELRVKGIDRVLRISRQRKNEIMDALSQMATKL